MELRLNSVIWLDWDDDSILIVWNLKETVMIFEGIGIVLVSVSSYLVHSALKMIVEIPNNIKDRCIEIHYYNRYYNVCQTFININLLLHVNLWTATSRGLVGLVGLLVCGKERSLMTLEFWERNWGTLKFPYLFIPCI